MSNRALKWARELPIRSPAKGVLIVLADRYNDETQKCFPSHKTIARDSGFAVSTVKQALKKLQKAGLISWNQNRREDGGLSSNHYQLNIQDDTSSPHSRQTPHPGQHESNPRSSEEDPLAGTKTPPRSADGEKTKVQTPTLKQNRKQASWQIRKDLEDVVDQIKRIKNDRTNHQGWEPNGNPNGGFPILSKSAQERVSNLKIVEQSLRERFEAAMLEENTQAFGSDDKQPNSCADDEDIPF